MKKFNLNQITVLLVALVTLTGCVQDDDFDVPTGISGITEYPVSGAEFNPISAVLGNFLSGTGDAITYEESGVGVSEKYTEGYIVSSDEGGNFFKELIIQDSPENPTAAIVVQVDKNPLFTQYEFGRKVFIKLNGLSVGESNGVIQLGRLDGGQISRIALNQVSDFVLRTSEIGDIVAKEVSILDFNNALESQYIRLTDVQFNRNLMGLSFASESNDEFDGERLLENCVTGASVILSTSTFSDFKGLLLPDNRGYIDCILTRDFFDEFYTVVINTPEGVNFTNPERCDPVELDCGLATTTGTNNLFSDDFETQNTNSLISGNGWTNFIQSGTEGWEAYTQTGTNSSLGVSARVRPANSNDASTVAWLITPAIDLDTNNGVTLNFQTSNSFANGSNMEVLFSSDWDGAEATITSATWGVLPAAYIVQDSDFFGDWFDSGNVALSCGTGSIYIAFKYTGSGDPDFDGTYELDQISIDAL